MKNISIHPAQCETCDHVMRFDEDLQVYECLNCEAWSNNNDDIAHDQCPKCWGICEVLPCADVMVITNSRGEMDVEDIDGEEFFCSQCNLTKKNND